MENRTNVTVMLTSPRPERRAFLLKGSKGSSLGRSPCASCNTLNVPGGEPPHPQPLQVPVLPPPASAAKPVPPKVPPRPNRNSAPPGGNPPPVPPPPVTFEKCPPPSGSASATKPPLVKMKNIHGLMVQPRTPSSGETRYVSEML
ncbi:hypothetical protein HDE_00153 [Halotydeus destructor]|nr:hypothetical protein HDE_00153 [Halotydeus destructor]